MIGIIPEKSSKKRRDQRGVHFYYRDHFEFFDILRVPEKQAKSLNISNVTTKDFLYIRRESISKIIS